MRVLRIGVVFVACAAFIFAAAALGAFSPAQTLSAKMEHSISPRIGAAANGNSVVAWLLLDTIFSPRCTEESAPCTIEARARAKSGTLGKIQIVSDPKNQASQPEIAVSNGGTAAFVWGGDDGKKGCAGGFLDCTRAKIRVRSTGGKLSPIQSLSAAGHDLGYDGPEVALDTQGRAYAVWGRNAGKVEGNASNVVEARVRSAGGALGPVKTLSVNGQAQRVFVTPQGKSLYFWYDNPTSSKPGRVFARARSAGGSWGARLAIPGPPFYEFEVAMSTNGSAVIMWKAEDPALQCPPPSGPKCRAFYARGLSATGKLGPVQRISDLVPDSNDLGGSALGMDASGKTLFVWTIRDGTANCFSAPCFRAKARTRTAGGSLGKVLTLTPTGQHAFIPDVAVDSHGNAMAVWQRQSGTDVNSLVIQGRTISRTGSLGPLVPLSGRTGGAGEPTVAVDPNGGANANLADAFASWNRADGTNEFCCFRIQERAQIAH